MSRRVRRSVDIFNLSFLDVVSCGFGAIILLLVIVKVSEPHVIERLAVDLSGEPAREYRDQTGRPHGDGQPQPAPRGEEPALAGQIDTREAEQNHRKAQADHQAEAPEHDGRIGAVRGGEVLERWHLLVDVMLTLKSRPVRAGESASAT
mgnify:CR=1 FL=1